MSVTLDGQAIFDDQGLTITVGSPSRASVERAIAGLDGMLSIDLGARSRQIRQVGTLHAPSRTAMHARIRAITAFIDGRTHVLATADGQVLGDLRMDSFKKIAEYPGGPGVVAECEIVYTQLGDRGDVVSP
jgi:hypothetical protein